MDFVVKFQESQEQFNAKFGEIHEISDGGYERGYSEGYDKGYEVGYGESYNIGVEQGKKEQYDKFWDAMQNDGNSGEVGSVGSRRDYRYAFSGMRGNALPSTKPKYLINTWNIQGMFYYFNFGNSTPFDMTEFCKMFAFPSITSAPQLFYTANVRNVTIDLSNATKLDNTFGTANGSYYTDNITLKITEKCTTFKNTFTSYQTRVIFTEDSVIGANFKIWANSLDKESIVSIINALSSSTTDKKLSLSKTAVDNAFKTSDGTIGSNSQEWATLIASKNNWTIAIA